MQVVLTRLLIPGPGTASKGAHPVVRRPAISFGIAPDIPVAPETFPRTAAFEKPCVTVGGVVGHKIEDDPQAARVSFFQQPVEVSQGAENRIHVTVVGDVVAEVLHRGRVERTDPDRVHTQPLEVVKPGENSRQITDPVAIAVLKTAGIDLVDNSLLPPAHCVRPVTHHLNISTLRGAGPITRQSVECGFSQSRAAGANASESSCSVPGYVCPDVKRNRR